MPALKTGAYRNEAGWGFQQSASLRPCAPGGLGASPCVHPAAGRGAELPAPAQRLQLGAWYLGRWAHSALYSAAVLA